MDSELINRLAIPFIPNIGPVQARLLIDHFGSASAIFSARITDLMAIEGIGKVRANCIKSFTDFNKAKEELRFIRKYNIRPLFLTDSAFPKRLLNCPDSPLLLFYKGEADLNVPRIISIIGTRSHSDYGKSLTEKLVKDLEDLDVLVVSGLAFGIDGIAHKAAMKNNLPTVGVLAHGLDQLYPVQHSALAKEMIKKGGGLLTEFTNGIKPDKHNFPARNRIVSGMSDATIVIETGIKGGSIITADLANDYNKEVFAFPGRVNDIKSIGCNYLIQQNKATLITSSEDLITYMQWNNTTVRKEKNPPGELSENELQIVTILKEKDQTHIDELNAKCELSNSLVVATVLNLELRDVVRSLPGKLYRLA
jgi:DNA processing protein